MSQQQNSFSNALIIPASIATETIEKQQPTLDNTERNRKRSYDESNALITTEEQLVSEEEEQQENKSNNNSTKERKCRKAPHELLSDAEKKANHITSEKKRRHNIRLGFDQLIEIVPSLTQGNRSEAFILQKSVDHIRQLVNIKNDLKTQVKDLQGILGEADYDENVSI